MLKIFIILSLGIFVFSCVNAENKKQCTIEEAITAENEAGYLYSWESLYNSYKRFSHCDDGSIAEGYSDTVVRLITKNWSKVGEFNSFVQLDKRFERFVLSHIDSLMSKDDFLLIHKHTQEQCPPNLEKLCNVIEQAAKQGR